MAQYTYLQVKQLFMELFCTTRTGIADPTIRHVKRCTFLVDKGEYDGETGYWVAEEETGDERAKEKAEVANKGRDLVFNQGHRTKARAI